MSAAVDARTVVAVKALLRADCTFSSVPTGMGCNECTHPSCQHSLNSLGIGQCVECDSGVLVLDPTSGPKWRMACNKCNVVVHFFEHAHKVQVGGFIDAYS